MGEENKCKCGCDGKDEFLDSLCEKYQPIKDNLIQMLMKYKNIMDMYQ